MKKIRIRSTKIPIKTFRYISNVFNLSLVKTCILREFWRQFKASDQHVGAINHGRITTTFIPTTTCIVLSTYTIFPNRKTENTRWLASLQPTSFCLLLFNLHLQLTMVVGIKSLSRCVPAAKRSSESMISNLIDFKYLDSRAKSNFHVLIIGKLNYQHSQMGRVLFFTNIYIYLRYIYTYKPLKL